jgi:hypothetical protein
MLSATNLDALRHDFTLTASRWARCLWSAARIDQGALIGSRHVTDQRA